LTVGLGGDSNGRAQELRREVRAIWPDKGPKLRMHLELAKEVQISQWLEDWAMNLVREIHFTLDPIVEAKPDDIVMNVTGVD
jgi:hypothetical protein